MNYLKLFLLLGSLVTTTSTQAAAWLTDLNAALSQAQREGKTVLIDFTGSDWCGWCIKLKREVFTQPEFEAYAERHLVLVEIDFPRSLPQSAALRQTNQQLARRYGVRGYPTILLLDPQGKEVGRTGYQPGGPKPYVHSLAKMTGKPAENATVSRASLGRSQTSPEPVPFGGAPTFPPRHYKDLELKSISGTKGKRFAMINNQTFAPGEAAKVKLKDGTVRVRCLEIREHSVLVEVEGQAKPSELKLASSP